VNSADIRSRWLNFFESGNSLGLKHTVVPSASLIADDPNLLLVNAGMVPFKPFFLGEIKPPYSRATSVQKCVRTLDIDEVGKTTRHASFFQMCGNFSFGDYFKEGAIALAWELLTKPIADGGYGFPEEKLWVTVFQNDDEAADIWHKKIGAPKSEFNDVEWKIIFGPWEFPAHAVRVLKFIMTEALSMVAMVAQLRMKIAI